MCGRYTLSTPAEELVEAFDVPALSFPWSPRYNIAPGQSAPILGEDGRGRRLGLMEWGFLPAKGDPTRRGFINARAESVATRVSFRAAFARRRCLVPADGYYEWRDRSPFWIHPGGGRPVTFAGVWETRVRPGVPARHTFAILTTAASEDVREVHDRMPLVVAEADRGLWLSARAPIEEVVTLLRPSPPGLFAFHAVSRRVNRTDADDPSLVEPTEE